MVVYVFTVTPSDPGLEILAAMLEDLPVVALEEQDKQLLAYFTSDTDESVLNNILQPLTSFRIHYQKLNIPEKNWNEEWEKNYKPVRIDDQIFIYAPFHSPDPSHTYSLCIRPQMSFGTGHHPTTRLMLRNMLLLDLHGKNVLDFGSGSGILGIFACLKNAGYVIAVDKDPVCVSNTMENAERNRCASQIKSMSYDDFIRQKNTLTGTMDVILANINRNVILEHLSLFHILLKKEFILLLSGFYSTDTTDLKHALNSVFPVMTFTETTEESWVCLKAEGRKTS